MKIDVTTQPDTADLATIKAGMRRHELIRLPNLPDESDDILVAAFARLDSGTIIAGIVANVYWDGVEIELLWVDEPYRNNEIGSKLVQQIESFARAKGAVIAFLKTVDAKPFYESLGYEVFGVLEDRPIGTLLYHMKKRLDR